MDRPHYTASLLCVTALLAGCGGGGGNVASTPPPPVAVTATPTPTPTPTPAATTRVPSAGKTSPPAVGTFGGRGIELIGPDRERLQFDYDASTGTYLILGSQYGPADSVSSAADTENGNFMVFDPQSPWGDRLTILTNSSNNSRIVLSYLSYGLYIPVNGPGVLNQPEVIAFLFGTETPAGNMPRTGSANYQGIVDGVGFDTAAGLQQGLRGSTGSLTANFATGNVSTSLSLRALNFTGTLSGSGTIGAGTSHFDGSLTGTLNGAGATGSFLGGFYGPNAVEAGYAFNAATGSPSNPGIGATGALVGKQ